jgi:hypothetical protein
MSTSKLAGALCAAGALFLAGCETTSEIPAVMRGLDHGATVRSNGDPRVPGVGYFVAFDANGSEMAPVDKAVLDAAGVWLKAGSDRCVVVDAHLRADADESERRLARTRIETVVSYVKSRHIAQTRIREGALREGLSEDVVLLREDPTCTDGKGGSGWAAATSASGRVASLGPASGEAGSTSGRSPSERDMPTQGGGAPTGSLQAETSQVTTPSGGSSSNAGSENSSNSGGTGTTEPGSGATGGSQGTGSTGQEPGATQGGGTNQSSGTGGQGQSGSQGGSNGNQGQNGSQGGGNGGMSSSTPAADRVDAGRGNGSESGDPGQSEGRNQGGDE